MSKHDDRRHERGDGPTAPAKPQALPDPGEPETLAENELADIAGGFICQITCAATTDGHPQ